MSDATLRSPWTAAQRHVVAASYLGWMLDAFDYFLVVFVLDRLAHDFGAALESVTYALFLTLAMRPVGALVFGRLADRLGRRPILMVSVLLYCAMEAASAFAPSLGAFLILRALYGIAMGGEWGVGASLAFESVPIPARGAVSGFLQAGYPSGYLLAAIAFGLLYPHIGWRGLFLVGAALPAFLVVYIYWLVPESPHWAEARRASPPVSLPSGLAAHWPLAVYAVVLMTCFNLFSHGTQDLFPTFLSRQRGFGTGTTSWIAIVYNVGAIVGGLAFGTLSGRIGRRRAIALAAVLALPAVPFWIGSTSPATIAVAAFVVQFMVQGAWGVVPVHLNELSPEGMRATFPSVVYQLGNLLASYNATLQTRIADSRGSVAHPDLAFALGLTCAVVAVALAVLVLLGPERRGVRFGKA
jgi:MFS transporter, SHS family, lactate transporter